MKRTEQARAYREEAAAAAETDADKLIAAWSKFAADNPADFVAYKGSCQCKWCERYRERFSKWFDSSNP